MSAEQLAKLRSELDVVQTNIQVFGEMLVTLQPSAEDPQDFELLMVNSGFLSKFLNVLKSRLMIKRVICLIVRRLGRKRREINRWNIKFIGFLFFFFFFLFIEFYPVYEFDRFNSWNEIDSFVKIILRSNL